MYKQWNTDQIGWLREGTFYQDPKDLVNYYYKDYDPVREKKYSDPLRPKWATRTVNKTK